MRSRARRFAVAASVLTVVLALGGAVGLWSVGAPATAQAKAQTAAEAVRTTSSEATGPVLSALEAMTREFEGLFADPPPDGPPAPSGPQQRERNADDGDAASAQADGGGASSAPVAADEEPGGDKSGTSRSNARAAQKTGDGRPDVPPRSGSGRRVVFDMGEQRVWLVRANGHVLRTYPVSGSKYDNLSPGHYEVYSTSRNAVSYTLAETMRFMVRFTKGENAAIGFHDIPLDPSGEPVQTRQQLGKPLSAGCIRQRPVDAKALWDFAPVGTKVVVIDTSA